MKEKSYTLFKYDGTLWEGSTVCMSTFVTVKSWYVTGMDGDFFLQLLMVLNLGKERGTVQNDYSAFDLRHFESKGFQNVKLCANLPFKSKGHVSLFNFNDSLSFLNFLLVHMSICQLP